MAVGTPIIVGLPEKLGDVDPRGRRVDQADHCLPACVTEIATTIRVKPIANRSWHSARWSKKPRPQTSTSWTASCGSKRASIYADAWPIGSFDSGLVGWAVQQLSQPGMTKQPQQTNTQHTRTTFHPLETRPPSSPELPLHRDYARRPAESWRWVIDRRREAGTRTGGRATRGRREPSTRPSRIVKRQRDAEE